jgi:hypothetical protein
MKPPEELLRGILTRVDEEAEEDSPFETDTRFGFFAV